MIFIASQKHLAEATDTVKGFFIRQKLPGTFDEEHFLSTWQTLMSVGMGFIITRLDGDGVVKEAVGIIIHNDMFSGSKIATTAFWFFEGENTGLEGGLLYKQLMMELEQLNVSAAYLAVPRDPRFSKVSQFLLKAGFDKTDTNFRKVF